MVDWSLFFALKYTTGFKLFSGHSLEAVSTTHWTQVKTQIQTIGPSTAAAVGMGEA